MEDTTKLIEALKAQAEKSFVGSCIGDDTFESVQRVHDWRSHIPEFIEKLWSQLSEEAKLVALILAERQADWEQWD